MDIIFSVVIPIFNSEKLLPITLKSVINQRNDKTEIILINDNSSDKSKKICQSFKKKFNFIKLINNKKNYGVGYCRNLLWCRLLQKPGYQKCEGKIYCFFR